ncbi:radical S-adenosyl methionine domain-containing protein 1, mitochondrial-like [Glandiceps talaboti]
MISRQCVQLFTLCLRKCSHLNYFQKLENIWRSSCVSQRTCVTQATTGVLSSDDKDLCRPGWHHTASIYVHWPYCRRRCTYCNFNKYINSNVNEDRLKSCLVRETTTLLEMSGVNNISSIFFGGGTPSLAAPSTIAAIIDTVQQVTNLQPNAEITLEANPTNLETHKLKDFKSAGVNRLSLGIQSLNNQDLKILGRDHSVEESLKCLTEAKQLFPGKTSVDLIFGRPGQRLDDWKQELQKILCLCDDHISLYQLTLERGTALFKMCTSGNLSVPDDDSMAELYELAVDTLSNAGFTRYEVSNFARNGAESSHNKNYWFGGQYIGVGPGAHGRFVRTGEGERNREARIQTLEPDIWMAEVEMFGHATRKTVTQTQTDILQEILLLGLRTMVGITDLRWQQFSNGTSLQTVFADSGVLDEFIQNGLLQFSDHTLQATSRGLSVIDSILPDLLVGLQIYYQNYSTHRNDS